MTHPEKPADETTEPRAPYVKIYGSILRSAVWTGAEHVKLTWMTLLLLADGGGMVPERPLAIAAVAGVTLDDCEAALVELEKRERISRVPACTGCGRGEAWLIRNHARYSPRHCAGEHEAKPHGST